MFDRSYELNCIIAINRADHASQLYVLQAGQAGTMKIYDHANGLREAPAGQVNGKLLVVGFVSLPTRSPRAILTTKALVSAAGIIETARYAKKQLRVVKGILKTPKNREDRVAKL
jgi:hypothetical protein